MTVLLDVTIPGCPISQRSKVVLRNGKDGKKFASLAKEAKTEEWRAVARLKVQEANVANICIDDRSVLVLVEAVGDRPSSLPKSKGIGRLRRRTKPDPDNVAKGALDALVKGGFLRDDVLVGRLVVDSLVAAAGESAHVRIVVGEWADPKTVDHPDIIAAREKREAREAEKASKAAEKQARAEARARKAKR